jgi:hypothetical protein
MPSNVNPHSFTEANGAITNLGNDRGGAQATGAINNAGQVVGTTGSPVSGIDGFLWTNGNEQLIVEGQTFGQDTRAFGVNDGGMVVGSHRNSANAGEQPVGFTWQNGTMSFFQVPNAATEGHGINNAGIIVGTANNYGFVKVGDQFGLFGLGAVTEVNAINNDPNGVVAGDYFDGNHWHGFIDNAGQMTFIDAPGASDTHIEGINDKGDISGFFTPVSGGPPEGFIATDPDPVTTMVREDYVGLFGHDADPGAQTFWTNLLKTGALTPRDFVWALTQSAESQSLHGGQTGEQFVNSVYVNALGRDAEPNTQTAWANVMRSGAGSWDVLSAIATSPEGGNHFAATHS